MDKYQLERDGQLDFFRTFLPRVSPDLDIEGIVADNNDGVINGNLLEFKLHITDLNTVLFQCIKYLSALRIKGKPVPANILIIDLNASTLWLYRSIQYLAAIEVPYSGGASKDNTGFIGRNAEQVLHYDKALDAEAVISLLKEKYFTKIHTNLSNKPLPSMRKGTSLGGSFFYHFFCLLYFFKICWHSFLDFPTISPFICLISSAVKA